MAKLSKAEQRKRILLVALGGLFVFALIYNLFLSPPTAKPTRKPANSNTPVAATPTPTGTPSAGPAPAASRASGQPEEVVAILMQDLTPLDLRTPAATSSVELDKERGDVFKPYVPPPPPPVKPPDPPPITLTGVTPASAVAGTPRKFTLTVVGSMIPADAQLFFDGSVKAARRLNEHQMAADIEPAEYAYPRAINITIKSASDPKMFSTTANFTIQPAPEPQFRYIGRLGELGIFELNATKEIKRLGRGDTIMGQWRIDAISDQAAELTLVAYDIKKRVPLTDKTR
jgi:hypothetical protein